MRNKFKLQPKIVVIITVIIGIVMITSAYFELSESKKDIFQVLSKQSTSLVETISLSSINTLNSSSEIENLIVERLLNNATLIRNLDSLNLLTESKLIDIGKENNLFRINIFDKSGNRVMSNRIKLPGHDFSEGPVNRYEELKSILTGESHLLIMGLRTAQHEEGERFAVAVARSNNRGAIVINLNAKDFLEFRKKIGIGKIIQDIADNAGIEYVVLQDTAGILAASTSIKSMDQIIGDQFLENAANNDSTFFRVTKFNNNDVYEVVKRLDVDNEFIGLYRIGLSLDEIKSVEAKMYRRIIVISFLLAAISVIVLSIIFTSQNLKTISSEFSKFKTFTGSILQNMGEAVIVLNTNLEINLFNKTAEILFKINKDEIINIPIHQVLNGKLSFISEEINKMDCDSAELQKAIEIYGETKYLKINLTRNQNESDEPENYTIVINDYSGQRNLEEQAKRQEKLSAMGELASGVAHEIRNPINTVGMIAQRLRKEFTPGKDIEEYYSITKVLNDEVTRVNRIITQFLNYAKPLGLQLETVDSKKYFDDISQILMNKSVLQKISFKKLSDESFNIHIDPELLKQALINIIHNAIEATEENGSISLDYSNDNNVFTIDIEDNGKGIPSDQMLKIFDLYFTTKKDGNGLGLSIAQKIINQHNGTIKVESKINKGTKFKILLPMS